MYGLLTYTGSIAAKIYVMSDSGFFSHRLLLPWHLLRCWSRLILASYAIRTLFPLTVRR